MFTISDGPPGKPESLMEDANSLIRHHHVVHGWSSDQYSHNSTIFELRFSSKGCRVVSPETSPNLSLRPVEHSNLSEIVPL
jgi:hypothetical protein